MKNKIITKNKGFTLIELLAVIVIMGILMLVAIPAISRVIENSRKDTFVDIAKSYVNAARNLWTTDNLTCEGRISSATDDGDYYILINTKEGAKEHLPTLLDQGGKSSWGNRDVNGYVRVNVKTTPGKDENGDGIYEVEPKRTTKFYVGLSDGTHGLIDDDTKVSDNLVRGDINMDLSDTDKNKIHLTLDDGKLNCYKTPTGKYVCVEARPIKNITGICIDEQTAITTLDPSTITPVSFAADDWNTISAATKFGNFPYQVNDTKTVNIGGTVHTVRISNLTPCDGSLESESACGVVLEFVDIIKDYQNAATMNNAGGWLKSDARTHLNSTVLKSLPVDLQNAIIETKVVSGHGTKPGETNFTSIDKLYLLSPTEIWAKQSPTDGAYKDTAASATRQLDYYNQLGIKTSDAVIKKLNGSAKTWWLRTPSGTVYFHNTQPTGKVWIGNANGVFGLSPAFRIA